MKTKDLILIALVCANITLGAVALVVHVGKAESAAVAATTSRSGDYVIVTGSVSQKPEGVLVIDVVAKRANLYMPMPKTAGAATTATWDLVSTRNLAQDFAGGMK
jgi:hypothetical protein